MANDKDDKDVIMPSKGTNHLLDPTQVGNSSFSIGTDEAKRMNERLAGDKSYDEQVKKNYELKSAFTAEGATSSYGLGTDVSKRSEQRLAEHKEWKKTQRYDVRGKVYGGGPKSTLRTPRKMFSSYGRGVPYSGNVANFFKAPIAGPAVGQSKHFIPNQGMFDMGITGGPSMLQGPTFIGAWPVFHFKQFTSATAAAPTDAEEED